MVELKNGKLINIDETEPKIEIGFEETIAYTSNNSNIFLHKSSRAFGYFIEVHKPGFGLIAIFHEKY